jgi:hypothetical protein
LPVLQPACPGVTDRIWATVLAVTWLRNREAATEAQWRLLVRKAMTWLARQDHPGAVQAWLDAADSIFCRPLTAGVVARCSS